MLQQEKATHTQSRAFHPPQTASHKHMNDVTEGEMMHKLQHMASINMIGVMGRFFLVWVHREGRACQGDLGSRF